MQATNSKITVRCTAVNADSVDLNVDGDPVKLAFKR